MAVFLRFSCDFMKNILFKKNLDGQNQQGLVCIPNTGFNQTS